MKRKPLKYNFINPNDEDVFAEYVADILVKAIADRANKMGIESILHRDIEKTKTKSITNNENFGITV